MKLEQARTARAETRARFGPEFRQSRLAAGSFWDVVRLLGLQEFAAVAGAESALVGSPSERPYEPSDVLAWLRQMDSLRQALAA